MNRKAQVGCISRTPRVPCHHHSYFPCFLKLMAMYGGIRNKEISLRPVGRGRKGHDWFLVELTPAGGCCCFTTTQKWPWKAWNPPNGQCLWLSLASVWKEKWPKVRPYITLVGTREWLGWISQRPRKRKIGNSRIRRLTEGRDFPCGPLVRN